MPNDLERSLSDYSQERPRKPNQIAGLLGITMGGASVVEVPNRNGYVYVRLRNNTSELIQAWNETVSIVYDLPVLVEWNGHRYIVTGRDTERYAPAAYGWGSDSPYLPMHGAQHSFAPELGYGGDVTWVYSRQVMPYATTPSGTDGAPVVWIQPHVYRNPSDNSWEWVGDTVSPNLLTAKPTGTFGRTVLLVWDLSSDAVLVLTGSYHPESLTGTYDLLPYIPTISNSQYVPLSAVRLVSGTTGIGWDNIYDMRQWAATAPGTFGGGFAVRDEGVPIGTGTTLDFVGDNVQATISGDVIRVFVTGSSGGTVFSGVDQIGIYGHDEGVPVGTGTILNVTGDGATLTRSGTVLNLSIPGGGGAVGIQGIPAQDEGISIGTGTEINFVGAGVTATMVGTVVTVNIPGGGGNPTGTRFVIRKADDTFRNSASNGNTDPHLVFSASANEVWAFDIYLLMQSYTQAADVKLNFSIPTGSSLYWGAIGPQNDSIAQWGAQSSVISVIQELYTGTSQKTFGTNSFPNFYRRWGMVFHGLFDAGPNGGQLALQWDCANVGSGTWMMKNSYMTLDRIV